MSDVANAPNTPPPSAPAVSEVPINPNPVNVPNPVGPQAPDKPPGEQTRPAGRREDIQKAFAKAREANPPKPRVARMGDNNPPEETKVERREKAREKLEPINLKKRPDDQEQPAPRERAEHGHFAPRQQAQPQTAQQPARSHPQLPEGTPYRAPPQRMSERAKAEWAATPEGVRGDVHRMSQEFAAAYQRYRPDVEAFQPIRRYHEMARQQGTTLDRALDNYTQMEAKLRSDPIGGLDVIVSNLNLRAPDGSKIGLRDIAWHILNQSPEQHQLLQSQNTQMAQSHQMQQMAQQQAALAHELRRMQYAAQFQMTRGALDRYADAHPRFDELGDLIEHEIKLGFDLDSAYRRAELLRPPHAAQTRSTTAQTRITGKSISGAPSGSTNGAMRRPDKPVGRREAIASAMKRANGSL